MKALTLFALLTLGCATSEVGHQTDWEVINIDGDVITIEVPSGATPSEEMGEMALASGGEVVIYKNYVANDGDRSYAVMLNDFPKEIDEENFKFQHCKITGEVKAIYRKPIIHGLIRGQESKLDFANKGKPWSVQTRQFVFGKSLLTLVVSGPRGRFNDSDSQRFLNSLNIKTPGD